MTEISIMKLLRGYLENVYGEESVDSYGNEIYLKDDCDNFKVVVTQGN